MNWALAKEMTVKLEILVKIAPSSFVGFKMSSLYIHGQLNLQNWLKK